MGEHYTENETQRNEAVVLHNLERMNSAMETMLGEESVGGNAGFEVVDGVRCPCGAAYGSVDSQSGEIIAFG